MEKNPQHLCTPSPSRGKSPAALSVWCKSLGCPKNRVDTEKLLGSLGMPITEAEDIRQARLVFVNTCGFITPAVKESIDSILEIIRDLEDVKHRPLLAVGGCMVGRWPGSFRKWISGSPRLICCAGRTVSGKSWE